MDCFDALRLMHEFLDEELDLALTSEFETHLRDCPNCHCHVVFERTMLVHIQTHTRKDRASAKLKKRIATLIKKRN